MLFRSAKEESRPARASDACYEMVFPLIDGLPDGEVDSSANSHNPNYRTINSGALGTLGTLCDFPPWLSMLVLPSSNPAPPPKALMDIDLGGEWQRDSKRSSWRIQRDVQGYDSIHSDFG